ncbi:uncharacterized protein LOC125386562 [Bombus terrestris]|uniref:Uncharacterized protein LOC125386562 n=1 Tax=Bombus terrestris TaxID=30195 RepID=A0A9C6SHW7_BOMTE|nr:uncharacterized protein LOC125386562 [Bombus terrestris]
MSLGKEWLKDSTFKLINLYQQQSVLWDRKHVNYRNREKKLLFEIGSKYECIAEEIRREIHNLKNQMSEELRKIKKRRSKSDTKKVRTSYWPYFNAFKFLIPVLIPTTRSRLKLFLKKILVNMSFSQKMDVKTKISKEPTNPPKVWTFKKRKCLNDVDEELCQVALQKLQEEPDNYDKFGQYIALQLRSLKSDFNKVRMRSEIKFIFK